MNFRMREIVCTSLKPALVLAVLAIFVAAAAGAILLYDGAWFLFQIMDSHKITIPQLRISFALMQWPAIWVAQQTDSMTLTRLVFSLAVMAMPPVSIAICWWIVRKDAPWLIVWPALGVFIVDLPGQMHWIATSIRTNQLFWPILMAIFIGMPDRVVPVVTILLISALFMHPQVSIYLLAGACAAGYLAWCKPEWRDRLTGSALVLLFASVYRFGIIGSSYETEEAAVSNQIAQWQRSVLWLPLIALVCALLVGLFLLLGRSRASSRFNGKFGIPVLSLIALTGAISLIIWAADASLWKTAIDYRGPSLWHSLIIMGIAFLDVALPSHFSFRSPDSRLRILMANGAALIFCVVIALQSLTWHLELNKIRDAMSTSRTACIAAETLPGYEDSPLNFWSLPPASIGMQSTSPDFVVLPGELCEVANQTGVIPMTLVSPQKTTPGKFVNMFHLRSRVTDYDTCWVAFDAGWHDLEQGVETRRWTKRTGVLIVMMDEAGEVKISGTLDSAMLPNEVQIRVNGEIVRMVPIEGERYRTVNDITLELEAGENVVEFVSMREPIQVGEDPRELSIAVINLEFQSMETEALCKWRDLN